jgi:ATP-dependent Clp protease ATP-binding subunit ClpX
MNKKFFMCSFCKRNQTEVKKLIVGPEVYICDFCTNICAEILYEEENDTIKTNLTRDDSNLIPEEIYKKLDEIVAGQEEAKKELSIAAYLHFLRMKENCKSQDDHSSKIKKYNTLLIGPTGCGKTLLVQTLAKILKIPCLIVDSNSLTETGYVGEDVENLVNKLFNSTDNQELSIEERIFQTEHGLIFFDEIDKKYTSESSSTNRDVSGRGVQQSLLKFLEGIKVQIHQDKKNHSGEAVTIHTENILIVSGGAFEGIINIVKQRLKQNFSLGLMTSDTYKQEENQIEIKNLEQLQFLKKMQRDDLITFGIIPELVGRFEVIAILHPLSEEHLVQILKDKKNNVMEEYIKIFQLHHVQLQYDTDIFKYIAQKAIKEHTGARALRSIIHNLFSQVLFTMPTICAEKKNYILILSSENIVENLPLTILQENEIIEKKSYSI